MEHNIGRKGAVRGPDSRSRACPGNGGGKPPLIYMFVFNAFRPDIRVLKEARTLRSAGFDVTVIAILDNNSLPFEELDGIRIIRVNKNHVRDFFLHDGEGFLVGRIRRRIYARLRRIYYRRVRREKSKGNRARAGSDKPRGSLFKQGLHVLHVILGDMSRFTVKALHFSFHQLNYLTYYYWANREIARKPGCVYHAHDLNTLTAAWWARKRFGGHLVYDSHELFTEQAGLPAMERRLLNAVEKKLIHHCDRVITVCDSIADVLAKRYDIEKPTVLLNCPPHPGSMTRKNFIREKLGLRLDTPIVLYQGGFSQNRGLRNLILASRFFERGHLVLMGWGALEEELQAMVRDNGFSRTVSFLPPVSQDVLLQWSGSASLGIIPYRAVSLNNYYSCPNKLFEYINAGLPVAASASPELKKVVEGYAIGTTFDPESPESIARAVNFILEDERILARMSENARKAGAVLNWENVSSHLLDVYHNLGFECRS